ncbi:Fur family transcriptional regulator [Acinetobacter bereziniae]|uniref:Fur family transcriptional regulator n=1 Tax=Acinetobacter bereziniae TaxID=106648 RepID=UPI0012504B34|nr:Fur family transcriptional regulator [Acinetobacter bereziniae]
MKQAQAQQKLLQILQAEHKAMSAYQLLEKAKPYGFQAPMQIYRVLKQLCEQKLIIKLNSLNLYIATVANLETPYQILTVCTHCQQVQSIAIPQFDRCVKQFLNAKKFNAKCEYLEVLGQCFSCVSAHESHTILK